MLYDYDCDTHGRFEARKTIAERATALCPACGRICQKVLSLPRDVIIPARFHYEKAGIREVTNGHSMQDIRYNGALRRKVLGDG